jgi:hypothetical protein
MQREKEVNMVDHKTAMKWAREAGFILFRDGYPDEFQIACIKRLITRAQNEAFEEAAQLLEIDGNESTKFYASEIRSLKQGEVK